jgi:hypothetical protein
LAGQKAVKPVIQPEGLLKTAFQGPRMGGIYAKYWISVSISEISTKLPSKNTKWVRFKVISLMVTNS